MAATVLIRAFDGLGYRASRMNFLLLLGKEKTVGGTFGGQSTPCSPSHLLLCLLMSDEEEAVGSHSECEFFCSLICVLKPVMLALSHWHVANRDVTLPWI